MPWPRRPMKGPRDTGWRSRQIGALKDSDLRTRQAFIFKHAEQEYDVPFGSTTLTLRAPLSAFAVTYIDTLKRFGLSTVADVAETPNPETATVGLPVKPLPLT